MNAVEKARTIFLALTVALLPLPSQAQLPGDTVFVKNNDDAIDEPSVFGDKVFRVSEWDTLKVVEQEEDYLKVAKQGQKGWVSRRSILATKAELREAKRRKKIRRQYFEEMKAEAKRRKKRRLQYFEEMKAEGYTVVLSNQTFDRNSAGGIDIGLSLLNISESKTIKYATAIWVLYNPVGDPVEKGLESSTAETRFVGPLESEEASSSTFENVWHSDVGSCAELKKLTIEHIEGSSFTYVNDLKDIARLSESIRLDGDCSYRAQQKRKN